MSRFNTGNPLGSGDPRDLDDNAKNMDLAVNAEADTFQDRLGRSRLTWAGMEKDFQKILIDFGYVNIGDYAAGLEITERYQVFWRDGELYRAGPSLELPYIITGDWAIEESLFFSVGDGFLRQELADPEIGGRIVSIGINCSTYQFSNVADALSLLNRAGKTGVFSTKGYLDQHRAGVLSYTKKVGGEAELLTDLSRFFPAGAFADPSETPNYSFVEYQIPSWVGTSTPDVHRYSFPTPWHGPVTDGLAYPYVSFFVDKETYRKYSTNYPVDDYSARLSYNIPDGAPWLYIRQPTGVAPPTQLFAYMGYKTDAVPESLKAVYIDPVNGNDFYPGDSFGWALKTFDRAIALEPDVIFIRPGVYDNLNYIGTYTGTKDLAIRCVGGTATFIPRPFDYAEWTNHSGDVYVSRISGSPTPVGCVDLGNFDEYGAPFSLSRVNTLGEVTPGAFYYDSATRDMYVQLSDSSVPVKGAVIPHSLGTLFRHSAPGAKVYLSDMDFICGTGGALSARAGDINSVLVTERVRGINSPNSNGFDIKDIGLYIGIRCLAKGNQNDGFNYTELNGLSPHFIEIDCIGSSNWGGGTSNGSTSHNSCVGFRIGTDVSENTGPGIADVGSAVTYNVNVTSIKNGPGSNSSGIRADGSAIVYADGAAAWENGGADFEGTNGGRVVVRDVYGLKFGAGIESI